MQPQLHTELGSEDDLNARLAALANAAAELAVLDHVPPPGDDPAPSTALPGATEGEYDDMLGGGADFCDSDPHHEGTSIDEPPADVLLTAHSADRDAPRDLRLPFHVAVPRNPLTASQTTDSQPVSVTTDLHAAAAAPIAVDGIAMTPEERQLIAAFRHASADRRSLLLSAANIALAAAADEPQAAVGGHQVGGSHHPPVHPGYEGAQRLGFVPSTRRRARRVGNVNHILAQQYREQQLEPHVRQAASASPLAQAAGMSPAAFRSDSSPAAGLASSATRQFAALVFDRLEAVNVGAAKLRPFRTTVSTNRSMRTTDCYSKARLRTDELVARLLRQLGLDQVRTRAGGLRGLKRKRKNNARLNYQTMRDVKRRVDQGDLAQPQGSQFESVQAPEGNRCL